MSPQFGKTPEAIKYQTGRESSRDNQNRAYLQSAIEELMDGMMALFPVMGTEEIPVDLFMEDIEEIQKMGYEDLNEIIVPNESGQTGRIVIDPKKLKGVEYRFNMDPDSTIKMDKDAQRSNLKDVMDTLAKSANILQSIQESTGKVPDYEKLLNSYATLADLPGLDSLFTEAPQKPDPATQVTPDHLLQANQQEHQQQMDQANLALQAQQQDAQQAQAAQQQESPLQPQSINGQLFHDPAIAAMAKDLHGMKGTSNASQQSNQ